MKAFACFGVAAGGIAAAISLLAVRPALAADPVPASGFYAGAHMGYLFGNATATLADPTGGVASAGGTSPYGTLAGGVQAGYQWITPSRWMLGLEADLTFANFMDLSDTLSYRATGTGTANEQLEFLGSLRGRVGYTFGAWTPYLTGGLAFASTRFSRTDLTTGNEDATPGQWRTGYTVGGGVDYMLDPRWSARLEYLYTNLSLRGFSFASAPASYSSQYSLNEFRVGLNYHFGAPDKARETPPEAEDLGPGTWEVHGQSTFIFQGYAPFGAPYSGQNSLPPEGQSRETWTSSLFLGMRLWKGGELYFNPELLQGFGVANTTGAAGFPNGEAQKSNFPFPRFNISRLFLRQEFGLGGETETVESDYGQLAGKKDVSRVTVQIGKFAVHDLFDTNDYAQDPRVDFLNWSIWASGAFDYPADRVGLTYGVAAELNHPQWAVRAGYFLVGNAPNANVMDWNLFSRGGYVAEGELRYNAFDHPGVFKVGPWLTSTFSGSYSQAVALANANPGLTANDTIAQTRQGRVKYGIYTNLQQEISKELGAFARWSWNNGQNETSAFTDISQSVSFGMQLKGNAWGRENDVIGLGAAFNMLSASAASYFAAGGMGVLVGDGALSYASENVFETYYALQLIKGLTATVDYQLLVNPAYNTVRGPVNVFSARLHAFF
ncbi:high affinity Mn2+ porin [Enhydrobacter aerosaccus]|uniref:High affinity Mn2+ porin n=1 Tax=Enhydrobacter aerosaccus TaxID=225324 RepID=A0A1T4P1U5_9HYPH|nr:carbohydrate porin [Enhydrobacter aerosaccus]SJZ85287.1 high affinity Mn2+ porin [Enhydrobacter aerosaccus]